MRLVEEPLAKNTKRRRTIPFFFLAHQNSCPNNLQQLCEECDASYPVVHNGAQVNYDVVLDGTITPTEEVNVEVVLPEGAVAQKIHLSGQLAQMESLDFEAEGQKMKFTLPQVNIYGLAVIDL